MSTGSLSERLAELRKSHWPGRTVRQVRVAQAIGVSAPSVSAYESGAATPSLARLNDYAVFFASTRWLDADAPERVDQTTLTNAEQKVYQTLSAELVELRSRVEVSARPSATAVPFWRFPDGAPIRIFCGALADDQAGKYADPSDHNFMKLRRAADVDSLMDLWGTVCRLNPESDAKWLLGTDFTYLDIEAAHVIVLGNIAQMQGAGEVIPEKTLAVRQVDAGLDGEVFEADAKDGTEHFGPDLDEKGVVTRDVGLLARKANPNNSDLTLTVCSGVFTHGVLGSVRTLTAEGMGDENAAFLRRRFDGADDFELLFSVRVVGEEVITPDLREKRNRLFEIPPPPS